MAQHCKIRGCGAYFPTKAGLAQHMFEARQRHAELAKTNKVERMEPGHKLFRHKLHLKMKRIRRNAAKRGMSPEEFARRFPPSGSGSGYKAGHGCGAGSHDWKTGQSGTYMKCIKCKATRTIKQKDNKGSRARVERL